MRKQGNEWAIELNVPRNSKEKLRENYLKSVGQLVDFATRPFLFDCDWLATVFSIKHWRL